MYSQSTIESLQNRIGWSVPADLPIAIDSNIENPDSRLKYNNFHNLVSLSYLYYTVDESRLTEPEFNKMLDELRVSCTQFALTNILDKSTAYEDNKSYDSIILAKANLFDEIIGLLMCMRVFEIYMASSRSNYIERNAKLSYQNLKIELEGVKNENGFQVAIGIRQQIQKAIKDIQKVIFPFSPTVEYIEFW